MLLCGNNQLAYYDRSSPELLISGPAGTGKTWANLLKLLWFCGQYPGARCLLVRKTRKSLAESAMVTLEKLLSGAGLLGRPIDATHRHHYKLPGGSVIVVGGMDDPTKVLSTEYDLIYVNEATDLDLNDWEELSLRLRSMSGPFDQMIADCNPESPYHWLYKRCITGRTRNYPTTHLDNPGYYDHRARAWTEYGERYLRRLRASTGIRYTRKYEGRWVSAEGLVYGYNPEVHNWPAAKPIPREWKTVWGIDWGKRVPTSLGIWAVDPDLRMYLKREVYQTYLRADVLGARAKRWVDEGHERRPEVVVCDHDTGNEGYKELFEKASGLHLTLADKANRKKGIQTTQARFDINPDDGKPGIYFVENARDHDADPGLVDSGHPTCGIEELVGYVWDENQLKDEPIEDKDHFCFVAGTLIETASGPVPIEGVIPGKLVWTRAGLRPVLEAGMTDAAAEVWRVELSDGSHLIGTGNHPVWTEESNWTRLDSMRYGDTISHIEENQSWKSFNCQARSGSSASGSWALSTAATRKPRASPTGFTTGPARVKKSGAGTTFTVKFGLPTTDRFHRLTRSITKTATTSTTISTTCKRCPSATIKRNTEKSTGNVVGSGTRTIPIVTPPCRILPPNGTEAPKAGSGTASTRSRLPMPCRFSTEPVSDAIRRSRSSRTRRHGLGSAATPARPPHAANPGSMMLIGTAGGAVRSSESTSTPERRIAAVHVLGDAVRVSERQPVYNLTVEGCNEYYGNGILLHNCDQMRYATRWVDSNMVTASQSRPHARPTPRPAPAYLKGAKAVY